jgi:hypothetical protein
MGLWLPLVSELSSIYSSFGSDDIISFLSFQRPVVCQLGLVSHSQPSMYSEVPSLWHEARIFSSHSSVGLFVSFLSFSLFFLYDAVTLDLFLSNLYRKYASHHFSLHIINPITGSSGVSVDSLLSHSVTVSFVFFMVRRVPINS